MERRRNIEHRGQVHTLAEWAEITGLNKGTIQSRLKSGWTVPEALDTPPIPRGQTRGYIPQSKSCDGCHYWRQFHYNAVSACSTRYCAYIVMTGHKRPCSVAHCTEYKPARQGRKGRK